MSEQAAEATGKMEEQQYLRMWFESVDEDNSGSINSLELQRALEVGNLKFPKSIVDQMIRMYDADQNGVMSFEEFVSLHGFLNLVQTSFSNVSRDRGFLALNEVYQALQQAGFTLDEPSFYTACQSFDPNRLGKFKLDDYISMCIFLQSAKNLFGAFDTSRIGHITLDFNQFVYCVNGNVPAQLVICCFYLSKYNPKLKAKLDELLHQV